MAEIAKRYKLSNEYLEKFFGIVRFQAPSEQLAHVKKLVIEAIPK